MSIFTKNFDSNYLAKVVKIPAPIKHPNADKLQLVTIDNNVVVTGMDAREGDYYVYFPLETAINLDFLAFSNSFADSTKNQDKTAKGFFHEKGRVKAVKLRGTPSEGYIVPLNSINGWITSLGSAEFIEESEVNKEFDTIALGGGKEVLLCQKYVPNTRLKGDPNMPKQDKTAKHYRLVEGQFRFHTSTQQLKKNIDKIQPESFIAISEKLHGTSLIAARVLTNKKLSLWGKILKKFRLPVETKEYGLVYSSRSVIKNASDNQGFYKEDIWGDAVKVVENALLDGISLYAEVVGYTKNGKEIQKGYDYNCPKNTFDVYVYRITYTSPYGKVIEFSTNQMIRYCNRFGIKHVPIHYIGYAKDLPFEWNSSQELLDGLTKRYLEKDCKMCRNKVPNEGVVITVDDDTFTAFKLKSWAFFERESKELDAGTGGDEE